MREAGLGGEGKSSQERGTGGGEGGGGGGDASTNGNQKRACREMFGDGKGVWGSAACTESDTSPVEQERGAQGPRSLREVKVGRGGELGALVPLVPRRRGLRYGKGAEGGELKWGGVGSRRIWCRWCATEDALAVGMGRKEGREAPRLQVIPPELSWGRRAMPQREIRGQRYG
jgi:hypothetical protein